jgi:hypothetical protein
MEIKEQRIADFFEKLPKSLKDNIFVKISLANYQGD